VASWWFPTNKDDLVITAHSGSRYVDVTPSARRLTRSLRDIGYDFASAVADIVDNSVSARARQVDIDVKFSGDDSHVIIADDGWGMTESELTEALRFGTRRNYGVDELGRYGLGLKTASLSQCRRLTVVTRTAPTRTRIRMRTLDLEHVHTFDRWVVLDGPPDNRSAWTDQVLQLAGRGPGTIVIWDNLDRVLPEKNPAGGWGRRRLKSLALKLHEHLGMVFHRFIEGAVSGREPLVITVNGVKVPAWNPFAPDEEHRIVLPGRRFEVWANDQHGYVDFQPYVLPARPLFSSQGEFERLSGPHKWNRQQGLYVYRADRLIQGGGWSGIRAIDEHTKLGRGSVDFSPALDELFRINVAKMRVSIPAEVRTLLEPEVTSHCKRAELMYRRETREGRGVRAFDPSVETIWRPKDASDVGTAILAAAVATDTSEALLTIIDHLARLEPDVVKALGW
jgi:hypothetical protein